MQSKLYLMKLSYIAIDVLCDPFVILIFSETVMLYNQYIPRYIFIFFLFSLIIYLWFIIIIYCLSTTPYFHFTWEELQKKNCRIR